MREPALSDGPPQSDRRPLGELAYERLVGMIIHGELRQGEVLREARLANMLGTSRVPVREALQRLAEEGWVVRRPHAGARVRSPTRQDIDEVFDLRVLLEGEAVRLASWQCSLADAERLRQTIAVGRAAASANDDRGLVEANSAFHRGIAVLTKNSLLIEMLKSLDRRTRWLFGAVAKIRAPHSLTEHEEIVAAMTSHEVDVAVDAIRKHVEHTRSALLEHWGGQDASHSLHGIAGNDDAATL